jgi:formiminotetrahydrofolate cyclodeaminase
MDAFDRVMDAWKMPSETDEEKAAKSASLEPATKNATEVPMEICRECLEILKLAVRLAPIGNRSAISDVGVGAYVAEAALRSAMLSVDINLPSLVDEAFRKGIETEKAALLSEAENLRSIAVTDVQKRM